MKKIISLVVLLCFSAAINTMDRVGSNQKDCRTELGRQTKPQNKSYKALYTKKVKKEQDLQRKQDRKDKPSRIDTAGWNQ